MWRGCVHDQELVQLKDWHATLLDSSFRDLQRLALRHRGLRPRPRRSPSEVIRVLPGVEDNDRHRAFVPQGAPSKPANDRHQQRVGFGVKCDGGTSGCGGARQ